MAAFKIENCTFDDFIIKIANNDAIILIRNAD